MRKIKFRKWNGCEMVLLDEMYSKDKEFNIDDYPLMQFTGLTDKNDLEVYEADKLKITLHDDEWETVVRDCNGTLVIDVQGMDYNVTALSFLDDEAEIEVIGNIYETKDQ